MISTINGTLARIFKARALPKRFAQICRDEGLAERKYLGLQTVEVGRIVASVDRWEDFDARFRFRDKDTTYRYRQILSAMEAGESLPPVVLYKLGEEYYVLDGNHRVAAAKELGQQFIEAYVTEFLPPADSPEHVLWRERSRFEEKTGLIGIEFSDAIFYPLLLEHICRYQRELSEELKERISLPRAARSWKSEIYDPIVEKIRHEKLLSQFPGRTEADLFLYLTHHRLKRSQATDRNVKYKDALKPLYDNGGAQQPFLERILDIFSGFFITPKCTMCGRCRKVCPKDLIVEKDGGEILIKEGCRECGKCLEACSVEGAIEKI